MPKLFITIALFFFLNPIFSQDYNYIHYTIKDGLAGNTVYGVAQDDDGYMFFATENGLSRFDGKEWKTFTVKDGLPDNEILTIYADSKGRVWMGQFNKTLCYYYKGVIHNSANDTLVKKINLKSSLKVIEEDGLKNVFLLSEEAVIKISDQNIVEELITVTRSEAIKLGNKFQIFTPLLKKFNRLLVSKNGKRYLYEKNELIPISKHNIDSLCSLIPVLNLSIKLAKKIIPNSIDFRTSVMNSYDLVNEFNYFISTNNGFLLISTEVNGFFEHFLPSIKAGHSIIDKEGAFWFTALGNGVYKLASRAIKTNLLTGTLNNSNKEIFSITKNSELIVGGASYGKLIISKFNNNPKIVWDYQSYIKFSKNTQDLNRATSSIQINNNTSILGFDSYLLKLQNNKPSFNYDVMPVKSIEKIDDDNVIVATGNHCYKVRISDLKIVDTIWDYRTTYAFYQNKQYYVGTLTGLYIVDANKKETYPGNIHPALKRRIVCIKSATDGILFVATADAGVVVLKDNKVVRIINDENGLSSNSCKTLHINNNFLWVGTINGITKIDLTEKNKTVHYSTGDGLPNNIINAIYVDNTDSTVWIGSPDGLTSFKEKDLVSTSICNLVMQGITVSNKALATDSNNYYLKHEDNNIRFQFVGISFRSGDDISYSYMLQGLDRKWQQTKERNLNYPTLESGDYTLLLFATNKFGVVSKTIKIHFTIETPFWETLWFRGLIVILFIAVIYFFLKRRFDKAKKEQAEKAFVKQQLASMEQLALQAQMNPHFIFNCLNSIQQFTMHDDKEKANKYLTDFAVLVRTTLDNSGKKNITIAEEALYLGRYLELEQLRFGDSFTYDIIIDESVDRDFTKMPAMLLQPYVENSLRHGIRLKKEGKGNVKVVFCEENNYLICSVKDNGVGRAASAKAKTGQHIEYQSRGMELTAKRIELLNTEVTHKASVTIIDLIDDNNIALGTEVVLKIPLEG
jgi:ligand-binding sensor domain-containing protein